MRGKCPPGPPISVISTAWLGAGAGPARRGARPGRGLGRAWLDPGMGAGRGLVPGVGSGLLVHGVEGMRRGSAAGGRAWAVKPPSAVSTDPVR
ncbi:hypothetical protein GCM10010910_21650 [Microbacterium nanhaiense]|uniref:Uncharacterized protein n=1 Tax=Microbacterium nanhaiense TaxID=1301026 RepID=A0ABQ2N1L6_9MICO|nr:hypothetical protein GCM10010910_21650 [Microbacterium nanhaiense]